MDDSKGRKSDNVSRRKYNKLKSSLKDCQALIKNLQQKNSELIDELESLKGVISVFSEQKLENKAINVEDEEEFEDNVESFNKANVKDDGEVNPGRFRERTNTQTDTIVDSDKKKFMTEKKLANKLKNYEQEIVERPRGHKKATSTIVNIDLKNRGSSEKPELDSIEEAPKSHIFDENTVLDILCGLGITSGTKVDDSVLVPNDYSYSYQFKVNRTSNQLLKFKDFAPKVFRQIRQQWNIPNDDLLFSFRFDNLEAIRGEGKSGAFFIFTKDKRFILKTATKDERDFLWELLPYYLLYIRKNPNTLLPRFYGVYSMKHEGIGGVTRFVIMNNWFSTSFDLNEIYDLKGSTVGRTTTEVKPGSILKDLDIKRKFYMDNNIKGKLLDQLDKDAQFLASHNVMDYSLLVGIAYNSDGSDLEIRSPSKEDTSIKSIFQEFDGGIKGYNHVEKREEIMCCGIIDILQQYNGKKKLEHLFKSMAYNSERISIVQPTYYSKRFNQFISGLCEEEVRETKKKKKKKQQ